MPMMLLSSYDGAAKAEVMDYGDATSAGNRDGYAGFEIVNDDGTTSTDTVLVFTNVGPDAPGELLVDEAAGTNTWFSVVDPDGDMTAVDAFVMHANADGFPAAPETGSTTVLLGDEVTAPGTLDTRVEFAGTWRGVPGVFVCSACSAEQQLTVSAKLDDAGERELTANFNNQVWVFQPDNNKVTVDVSDDAYLKFGFWKSLPKGTGTAYDFATFFGGEQPMTSAVQALEGEAEFVGVAAGKYIVKEGTRFAPTFRPGVFTAKATLKADFEDENATGSISGSISDFMENGQAIDGSWSVELSEAVIEGAGTFTSGSGADNEAKATIHGATSETSSWNGGLYNGGDAVAGEFQASFSEQAANLAGAFGATVEE